MEAMTLQEYSEILQYIKDNHRFGEVSGKPKGKKHIKYVDNCFDMRTLSVWSITFRGMGEEKTFATTDDPQSKKRLYDIILNWLN